MWHSLGPSFFISFVHYLTTAQCPKKETKRNSRLCCSNWRQTVIEVMARVSDPSSHRHLAQSHSSYWCLRKLVTALRSAPYNCRVVLRFFLCVYELHDETILLMLKEPGHLFKVHFAEVVIFWHHLYFFLFLFLLEICRVQIFDRFTNHWLLCESTLNRTRLVHTDLVPHWSWHNNLSSMEIRWT